ncbi:MAG TPA: Rrf2 family transcriptional regulator [Bryobacteraceae bacterium]|jgi:FeS assembly SUF system regulator|nr:Rrf2 family transcriptional regulator [Bryobacteraceae bacterium]
MLKLTKKADYGLIALRHLATAYGSNTGSSAKDIADAYRIPLPLLSKILQQLARTGLLASEQGTRGGYKLARDPHEISALEVIRAIDGPIILTHCFTEHAECDQSDLCPVREPLRKVHEGILKLLSSISIWDMSQDEMAVPSVPLSNIQQIGRAPAPRNLT